ncbi:hypothetical protein EDD21DRAFT_420013 [Dissophora ornata]|nr:hypothetical protein EDD21DRAFT_420013 [Dissophora ornata]
MSMSAKLYVGNLSLNTTDDTLRNAFSVCGNILDSSVTKDRGTGRSRGFGFVTFGSLEEADNAVAGLSGKDLDGRNIKVGFADERGGGGGGGGGGFRAMEYGGQGGAGGGEVGRRW